MRKLLFILRALVATVVSLLPLSSSAITGQGDDAGGGTYKYDVHVAYVSSGKSYSWCTGDGEDASMERFRDFSTEHNATISTSNPTLFVNFRYHYPQSKEYNYNGSTQQVYVITRDGFKHKIADKPNGQNNFNQLETTFGYISNATVTDDHISFRFAPNLRGVKEIQSIVVDNLTDYHQSNFWHSDYDFSIRATYTKDVTFELSQAHEASVEWISPGKVRVSADNSWLPNAIGNNTESFLFQTSYSVRVLANDKTFSQGEFTVQNRDVASHEFNVPLDQDFAVEVTRNTTTSFNFAATNSSSQVLVDQSLNENAVSSDTMLNSITSLNAMPNQVEGNIYLDWESSMPSNQGEYQIYRTELDANRNYVGNRELAGTTSANNFTDNTSRGLKHGRYYRYEVFMHQNCWPELNIPSNPEPLTVVGAAEVYTNTLPVIPLHLIQDASVTDNIKFDWKFGNIPKLEDEVTFKVHRIEPDGSIRRNYLEVTVPRTAGSASFTDEKPETSCTVYGYFVQLDLYDNHVHLYSDTVQAHVLDGTTVTSMTATKGTSGNSVEISWKAHQVGTLPTLFHIQRRFIGSGDWLTIRELEGTSSTYAYTDNNTESGHYYEYRVVAYARDCDNGARVISNSQSDVGFAQATGVVSGRVQFDTGTAVDDVRITLLRQGDENDRRPYFARQMLEDGKGMEWHTTPATANNLLKLDRPFTMQMWLNPDDSRDWVGLFSIDNYDTETINESGQPIGYYFNLYYYDHTRFDSSYGDKDGYTLSFKTSGTEKWFICSDDGTIPIFEPNTYTHLTLRNNADGSLSVYLNGSADKVYTFNVHDFETLALNYDDIPADENGVVKVHFCSPIGRYRTTYKGIIDEVRLWNRALAEKEIANNYNRILSGRESGLKLYWTFDEGLEEYAFDNSYSDGAPNGNHPILGRNSRPTDNVPSDEQLSTYGVTNERGEYEVRGIPFTGSGTRYSVYPTKGTHSFTPTSRSAFIGGTSLNINNADFTDVSSFKVRGTVRYAGTTIPVDSVSFYVDGTPCNKNDKLIQTDANGEYEISVPIGSHYIEARRNGHTFENGGRYPAAIDETYEFLSDTHLDFSDNTLVTLAGRVTGGNTEGMKPLGYGQSMNTIGQAVIALTPLDHPQRMLNAVQQVQGTTTQWVPNPDNVAVEGASSNINSSAYRSGGGVDDVKCIYITTDASTGEFSARVPPLRYKVQSVKFAHNPSLEHDAVFESIPAINITTPTDTIIPDTIFTANKEPLPLFKCNQKLMLTYRSRPVLDITQNGVPAGAFGSDSIAVSTGGESFKLATFTYDEESKEVNYIYDHPIFQSGRNYEFKVKAYEPYTNYDRITTGKVYHDMLRDSIVTFDNEVGDAARIAAVDAATEEGYTIKRGDLVKLEPEQVLLDSIGEGTYKWTAGLPNLNAPYTRNMNATLVIRGQTHLWRNEGLNAVITGVVPTGNNFITAGPSYVQMVLRDPPGDASKATWATDSVTSNYTYTVRGIQQGTEIGAEIHSSLEVDLVSGTLCFAKITYNNIIHENTATWKYNVNKTWDSHKSVTYSNSSETSSSASNVYVGRDGDVFIGYSTNYIIGAADKVGLFEQSDGVWGIELRETMTMDEKFDTHFEYSQKYIETTLFDNIKRTRDSMLKHINSTTEIEENPLVPTYYTLLDAEDPRYGSSNNDREIWGAQASDGQDGPSYYARFPEGYEGCDSVMWCNEITAKWKRTLADNEEDKIKAFDNDSRYKIGNESFETGTIVSKGVSSTTREVHNSTENFTTSIAYKGKNGYLLDRCGALLVTTADIGYVQTKQSVDETTTSERFSYTLHDSQRNNAHTVDVYNSTRGWSPIFRTRGGQTRCPYEGETKTKYYRPGLTLDYATMKSDNPHMSLDVRNFVDIPAGQSVNVPIMLHNNSETQETFTSAVLSIEPASNPHGLQVLLDGRSISSGTEVWMEYGEPQTRLLTIKQTDTSILDYDNVVLILRSSCENLTDPAYSVAGLVAYDMVPISVHFVPAAPQVTLKLDRTIINQRSESQGEQVTATISDINRQFHGLKGIRLKYRFAGDDRWIVAHEWMTSADYLAEGHETATQSLLPSDRPDIVHSLDLPRLDGLYRVVAESICDFGGKDYTASTPEIEVVRDTRGPKLLGQAYPNTGLLTPTDDIRIKFNESIRESYLTKDDNFFITGSLNDAQVGHDVSLQFNGTAVETDAYLPITNTSFAASLWLKRRSGGTIIEHGTEGNMLSVGMDDAGHVSVSLSGTTITSTATVPADKWVFLGMNYVKGSGGPNTLSMIMAEDDNETMLFDETAVPDYNATGQLSLGQGFTGMMHELVLWNKNTPVRTLLAQKDEAVAPYLPGLVGYWKMDEGHGTVVTDHARSRNIHLPAESWNVENANLAAHLDGKHSIKIPIGSIAPRETDSYVVETWFRGVPGKNAGTTLLSVTDRLSIGFDYDNSMRLHIYNDTLSSLTTNGLPIVLTNVDYNDGQWHHLALNVRRGISAVVYIDGKAVKTLAEQQLPAPSGDLLRVGSILKRNSEHAQLLEEDYRFTGDIDELRIWNAAFDGTSIIANRYNQVDTSQVAGLVAYFPMERQRLDGNGNIITEFSLENKAPTMSQYGIGEVIADGITAAATAPALRSSPLKQNLDFDFTASDSEIFINLRTLPSRMQGNLLTFIVKNVRDLHDNLSETITWSAVVNYGTLEWAYDGGAIEKDRLSSFTTTATLHNKGRESGHFAITGLPSWIVASVSEGVLAIDESIAVNFTIGADAPVGTHIIYAYAVNDADICAPLMLEVTVKGNEPLWNVNPSGYESSMNIIGQFYVDDKICGNTGSKIAAFVGGECRGVASPQLVRSRDAYFVNLNVYGVEDITRAEPITFRIYDADQGVVLADVTTTLNDQPLSLTYMPNGLVGNYDTPVKWMPSDLIEQLCDLKTGWNWISLYVQPDSGHDDLESVFGHAKVFNTIKGKEGFAMNSGTKWTSTGLERVEVGNLYKLKVKNDVMHSMTGSRIDTRTTSQTIYPGWNWIGPLSIYNLSLSEAFADLQPTRGDIVKSKSQVAFFDGYKWEGDLTVLVPGMGYYYQSANDQAVTFHYPTIDATTYHAPAQRAPLRLAFDPVDHHQFSDNMNVVAQVTLDGERVDTLTVAAFVDGECRGVTRATDDGYYLLTIAGNADESGKRVYFATIIDGETLWMNEHLLWGSDIIYGDLDEPTLLTIANSGLENVTSQDGIIITPTLVHDVVTVMAGSQLKQVRVLSPNGSRVAEMNGIDSTATLHLGHLPAGVYLVQATTVSGSQAVKRIVKR